jgi:hypothetical protein
MNERIWELFRQANHPHPEHGGNDMFFPEEFAELIVRECADVVHKRVGPKSALDVLDHFGVEE